MILLLFYRGVGSFLYREPSENKAIIMMNNNPDKEIIITLPSKPKPITSTKIPRWVLILMGLSLFIGVTNFLLFLNLSHQTRELISHLTPPSHQMNIPAITETSAGGIIPESPVRGTITDTPPIQVPLDNTCTGKIIASDIPLRQLPDPRETEITKLQNTDEISIASIDVTGSWYEVFVGRTSGWVFGIYIEFDEPSCASSLPVVAP
jgi:hypothetical protein